MATNRTPIGRPPRSRITPRAVELFRQMRPLPYDDKWWKLHSELCRELKLEIWQWPAIEAPDAVCTYPANTAGGIWFPEAQRLYVELERAAAEAET